LAAAQALYRLVGGDHDKQVETAKKNTDEMKQQGLVNESTTNDTGMDFGQLSGADGGIFKGPKSGYPVLMHGTEAIVPMDKLTGASKLGNFDQMFGGPQTPERPDAAQPVSATPAAATIKSLVTNLTTISKSMTTGSIELDDAFDEIIKDSQKVEKLTDADTKRAEKYNLAYKSYIDLKTQLMDLETPNLKQQIDILQKQAFEASGQVAPTAGGQGSPATGGQAAPTASGTGLKLPSASSMPSMGGGQGIKGGIASQNDLTKLGLKLKTGDVQAEGGKIDPKIIEMAQQVQANMPNFGYFSGFNDKFHQEKSPSSSHTTGRAMDFALSQQPSIEEGQEITKWLKSMGASVAIDEYNNPSSKATAGHIHAQIAGYADGGIASSPQIAMVAEKGPEAMIPLVDGAIPINLKMGPSPEDDHMSKIFEAGFGELSAQFAKLTDIDLLKSTIADFKNGQFGLEDAKEMLKSNSTEAKTALDDGAQRYERMLAEALEKQAAQQADQSARMIDALSEMIRTQKDSNSIQERILQTSM
jgi:hypothetical protein